AENAERGRFNEKLEQDRPAARAQGFARPDLFRAFLNADESDIHDADRADEKGKAGNEKAGQGDRILDRIERALERLLLVDIEIVFLFRSQSPDPPHQPGQLAFCIRQFEFIAHFDTNVRFTFGAKEFLKRRERHDHDRVEAEEAEKGALTGPDTEDTELLPADLDLFSDRSFP